MATLEEEKKQAILQAAKQWFKEKIAANHISNTEKLASPKAFQINPFLTVYLARFLTGNTHPESIAKALLFPRVLGTSINTTFGTHMQSFIATIQDVVGSVTSGMDIEFIDSIDGRKKYCQIKAGPNTINKDDVETIAGHFKSIKNLSRTNRLYIANEDLIVGILYGESHELSTHYKRIQKQYGYEILIGKDFWHHLTGDPDFYYQLIAEIGSVALETDYSKDFERIIQTLAQSESIQKLSGEHG